MKRIPVTDTIIYAIASLVDDAQTERRDPSHSDIEFQINKAGLTKADPNIEGPPVGKAKRVRTILSWALENNPDACEKFASGLISHIKSCGGFRETSPNFVGEEAIENLSIPLKESGVFLGRDGTISPIALESLSGKMLTEALKLYVIRAKKGIEDAALMVGTSKDLMEAVAAHVLQELWGNYPTTANFPTLLGQAFTALDMATPQKQKEEGEHPRFRVERAMYEMACSINRLRNKQGAGHGRPWLSDINDSEAKAAVEFIGIISEVMLSNLERKKA